MKSKTPLYDALRAFADTNPLRMHMPGHKGKGPFALDFTELPPTGNLFEGGGPIGAAESLWADVFHMAHCLFLTGGSTQGILTALTLACRPGDQILLDRNSHRSAYNALALLDLSPIYVQRPPLPGDDIFSPISPKSVENLLRANPRCKTFCITSPTYYGVLSDIPAFAEILHSNGGILIVDAAHGAHLPFLGNHSLSYADLVVASAHKTLPAPGQSALLFASHTFHPTLLRQAASLYGSSSPSYLMMAELDRCRWWMEDEGAGRYQQTALAVDGLRAAFPALSALEAPLDPCRLVIRAQDGYGLERALQAKGVYPEMADRAHVVMIATCADSEDDFHRLASTLRAVPPINSPFPTPCGAPPDPEIVLRPREALFCPAERITLSQAEGRVAAGQVAPYPPGVPVVAPGERITKKTIAYLYEIGYNMEQDLAVVPSTMCV